MGPMVLFLLLGFATLTLGQTQTGPCPRGWLDGTRNNSNCYYLRKGRDMSWADAWKYCKTVRDGSFLAEPKTLDHMAFVNGLLEQNVVPAVFVGATAEGEEGRFLWRQTAEEVELPEDEVELPESGSNGAAASGGRGKRCLAIAKSAGLENHECSGKLLPLCEMLPAYDSSWLHRWYRLTGVVPSPVFSYSADNAMRCEVCQMVAARLKEMVRGDLTRASLEAAIDRVCGTLPFPLSRTCHDLVGRQGNEMVAYMLDYESVGRVCILMRICHEVRETTESKLLEELQCPHPDFLRTYFCRDCVHDADSVRVFAAKMNITGTRHVFLPPEPEFKLDPNLESKGPVVCTAYPKVFRCDGDDQGDVGSCHFKYWCLVRHSPYDGHVGDDDVTDNCIR